MIEANTRRGRGASKENILKVKTLKFFLDWKESANLSGKQIFEATKIAESTISRAISKDDMKLSMLADICAAFGSKLSMRITRNGKDITDIMVTDSEAMHKENVLKRYRVGIATRTACENFRTTSRCGKKIPSVIISYHSGFVKTDKKTGAACRRVVTE